MRKIRMDVHRIVKALQVHPLFIKKRGFTLSIVDLLVVVVCPGLDATLSMFVTSLSVFLHSLIRPDCYDTLDCVSHNVYDFNFICIK